ncbi:vWA domain-containing protein [Kangiella koreensis]|uniref:von Willebrand factor type A n=1 Tax=Kangiella koreensis (strain DSM 16069 / JCM 12317 / KCTC 12182 / SW-125) TaxID=523791 RepID=C7R7E7_KANKD|nr:VWA domain-containing protein [Kangiella koreensis]ACV25696.1 von Willebrand factor type A [Kangiella koreensis DSM 16069]
MNTDKANTVKTSLKISVLASMVALAISGCQNTDTGEQRAEQDKRVEIAKTEELQRQKKEQEQVVVTGARIMSEAKERNVPMYDMAMPAPQSPGIWQQPEVNREQYQHLDESGIFLAKEQPVSTFSIDVDTGSYSNVRRMLNDGYLPPEDAVRLEEFVNYFNYDYQTPDSTEQPFAVNTHVFSAPWNSNAYLMEIGIKGFEPEQQELPPSNLVYLIDVSGSMNSEDKLGLVKKSLKLLAQESSDQDRISIVVYAGASGVVLEPTKGNDRMAIEQALDRLSAGGSTNGGAGIELAYKLAEQAFIKDGINRVILATDGDFNVGTINREQLIDLVERKRESGISFTTLGFGSGNYNEHLMEQLADKGNGNYGYIDSLQEARKLLVEQRAGTLMTIAKDVKIQVEFNPQVVAEYRLLGYENRALNREDFNNDKVDAGEIGAGHTVTALYEVVLVGSEGRRVDELRYSEKEVQQQKLADEAALVKLRYKMPDEDDSKLISHVIDRKQFNHGDTIAGDRQFAASVAGFAQLLRGGRYLNGWDWQQAIELAQNSKGADKNGYRGEMIQLMKMAQLLDEQNDQVDEQVSNQ